MVKVEIGGVSATLRGSEWASEDAQTVDFLTELLPLVTITGADPWPEMTIAKDAVSKIGGTITDSLPPEFVSGRIY